MKKFSIAFIVVMLFCFAPVFVYARPLDAEAAKQELGFSVTSGIDMSKQTQSTFDDSKTIAGVANQGTAIEISVSSKDANGDLTENANFVLEVGVSGIFSQTVELSLGENVVEITSRGHVSAGHGRVGKHRCHPSGRGKAGGLHHLRILFDKFHPGYFGKVGIRHLHLKRNQYYCPTANVDELWNMLPEEAQEQAMKDTTKAPVIDLTQHGVFKLLGRGRIDRPVVVKTKFISSIAENRSHCSLRHVPTNKFHAIHIHHSTSICLKTHQNTNLIVLICERITEIASSGGRSREIRTG